MTERTFPARTEGTLYLTEGGFETEILYRHGLELPHFAAFPLLTRAEARPVLRGVFERALEVAVRHGFTPLFCGLDYRASPDWGRLLGYSEAGLAEATLASLEFVQDVFRANGVSAPRVGCIGPRGDAYGTGGAITAEEAEDYHAVQLATLRRGGTDLAIAMTFNNVPEAVGVTRAARAAGVPLAVSFTVTGEGRLRSGASLRQAVETVDAETGAAPAFYMINCAHPVEFEPGIGPGDWIRRVRGLKPNASKMEKVALCKLGHLEEGDWEELGRMMADLARRHPHMDVWGSCCGSDHKHLEEIARGVAAVRRAPAPA